MKYDTTCNFFIVFKIYINEIDFFMLSYLKSGTNSINGAYSEESIGNPGKVVNDVIVLNIDKLVGYFLFT